MSTAARAWYERHKTKLLGAACGTAAAYVAYRVYKSSALARARAQLFQFANAASTCSSALASIGDCAGLVTSDLRAFLDSDSEEVPRSLVQFCKLLQSEELQAAVQATTAAVARGVTEGVSSPATPSQAPGNGGQDATTAVSTLDKILEAILSDRGRSLIGMAVGVATKNATSTVCEYLQGAGASVASDQDAPRQPTFGPAEALAMLTSERGERLLSFVITQSMRTGVSTYCEAFLNVNTYEDMLKAVSRPEHREAVVNIMSRLTGVFVREAAMVYRQQCSPVPPMPPATGSTADLPATGTAVYSDGDVVDGILGTTPASTLPYLDPTCPAGEPGASVPIVTATTEPMPVAVGSAAPFPTVASFPVFDGLPVPSSALPTSMPGTVSQGTIMVTGGGGSLAGWLRQAAEVARERDFRSLAVDVACASTREATREALSALLYAGTGGGGAALACHLASRGHRVPTHRMYVLMCMMISLFMYAVSPRLLVL